MKRAATALAVSSLLAVSILACVDLFHDTDDLIAPCANGACAEDADSPDGGPPPLVAACTNDPDEALVLAEGACAWLGACAGPTGVNEPGTCLLEALRAYDCGFDPLNLPREERALFWNCMRSASTARSCEDVMGCVFPRTNHRCTTVGDLFACPDTAETAGADRFVRVYCKAGVNQPAGGENCAAAGGRCIKLGSSPGYQGCSTTLPSTEAPDCTRSSCQSGNILTLCDDDAGVETAQLSCTLGGGGRCGSGDDAGPGCIADNPADGGCTPDTAVECKRKVATRCRNGVIEDVDCARAGLDCNATGADLTHQACRAADDAGTCTPGCTGGGDVRACVRGRAIVVDCASQGLGACAESTLEGKTTFACSTDARDAGADAK